MKGENSCGFTKLCLTIKLLNPQLSPVLFESKPFLDLSVTIPNRLYY